MSAWRRLLRVALAALLLLVVLGGKVASASPLPATCGAANPRCDLLCSSAAVVCLDAVTGQPICGNSVPSSVTEGASLDFHVIGMSDCNTSQVQLVSQTVRSVDTVAPPPAAPVAPSVVTLATPAVLKELSLTAASDTSVQGIQVRYQVAGTTVASYFVEINHGHYFVDLGVMMAFSPNGSRTVGPVEVPAGGTPVLGTRTDWDITAALVVNVYPFLGHRRASTCAFCSKVSWWDVIGDGIGIQGGTDLNLAQAGNHYYLGLVLEPVTGVSLNGGIAWIRTQSAPPGYSDGTPLSSGFQPDYYHAVRGYIGATVSLSVINLIGNLSSSLRGMKFQ